MPREHIGDRKTLFKQYKRRLYRWNHQRVNTEIRLITLFAAKMEKIYTVSKKKTGS